MKQSTVSVFSGSWPGIIVFFLYTVTDFRSLNPMHPLLQKKKKKNIQYFKKHPVWWWTKPAFLCFIISLLTLLTCVDFSCPTCLRRVFIKFIFRNLKRGRYNDQLFVKIVDWIEKCTSLPCNNDMAEKMTVNCLEDKYECKWYNLRLEREQRWYQGCEYWG